LLEWELCIIYHSEHLIFPSVMWCQESWSSVWWCSFLVCLFACFNNMILLCSLGLPGIYDPSASVSWVLGLQACTTMPNFSVVLLCTGIPLLWTCCLGEARWSVSFGPERVRPSLGLHYSTCWQATLLTWDGPVSTTFVLIKIWQLVTVQRGGDHLCSHQRFD
jgi:hypothetical protein